MVSFGKVNLAPEFNIFIGRTPSPYVNRNKGKKYMETSIMMELFQER